MQPVKAPAFDPETCPYVAGAETTLRCAKCSRPLLVKDANRTPVGYVCPNFVRGRVATFYNANTVDYVIVAVVAGLGGVAAGLALRLISGIGFFGIYLTLIAGPALGGAIAEVIRRALNKRRGQHSWIVASIATVIGAAPFAVLPGLAGLLSGSLNGLFALIPAVGLGVLVSTLIARLRI